MIRNEIAAFTASIIATIIEDQLSFWSFSPLTSFFKSCISVDNSVRTDSILVDNSLRTDSISVNNSVRTDFISALNSSRNFSIFASNLSCTASILLSNFFMSSFMSRRYSMIMRSLVELVCVFVVIVVLTV